MNFATLTWLTFGACLIYTVVQDANVFEWLVLQSRRLSVELQRFWFTVRHNPDSPWVRWEIDRNARKLADEFLKDNKHK